jgi:hypothetical protein
MSFARPATMDEELKKAPANRRGFPLSRPLAVNPLVDEFACNPFGIMTNLQRVKAVNY